MGGSHHSRYRKPGSDGLWLFSLGFYGRSGVAAALIALQDSSGLDVNLILFAIWLGLSGRGRLDQQQLNSAEDAVRTIRVEVTEPLRALRRRLKSVSERDIRRLREKIKKLELDAERAALARLAALAGPLTKADNAERLADADANFLLYLGAAAQSAAASEIRDHINRPDAEMLSMLEPVRPSV
jgi:uncharacterized protein (TIGR02444 family)